MEVMSLLYLSLRKQCAGLHAPRLHRDCSRRFKQAWYGQGQARAACTACMIAVSYTVYNHFLDRYTSWWMLWKLHLGLPALFETATTLSAVRYRLYNSVRPSSMPLEVQQQLPDAHTNSSRCRRSCCCASCCHTAVRCQHERL
jgi:hypothetical protein